MKALLTGGAGFIGSTVAHACADAGLDVVILDNLSTGRAELVSNFPVFVGEISDARLISRIFDHHPDITHVIHCAARIVVPESVADPIAYYKNNVSQLLEMLTNLTNLGCHRLIFSSSAAIYEPDADLTVDESSEIRPSSPYAATKAMAERIISDVCVSSPLRAISLRYFNPIGADPKLRCGLQTARPSHALGQMMTAYVEGEYFNITGTDWPTRDGTGLRDYVHVWDLAQAHVKALMAFDSIVRVSGHEVINLGTGAGTTVRELIQTFEKVVGDRVRVRETAARDGDVIGCYTRSEKARKLLHWQAERTLEDGIRDSLAWMRCRGKILPTAR